MKTIIKNATIPDFSRKRFVRRHLVIDGGYIKELLPVKREIKNRYRKVIDASGLIVSPGFIDAHSHSDLAVFTPAGNHPKIRQGVTTEVVGNCGISTAPVTARNRSSWRKIYLSLWGFPEIKWDWTDTASYLAAAERSGSNRVETLLGYSTLRYRLTGLDSSPYDKAELKKMEALINRELEKGAKGISLGIGYPPNIYARPEEYRLITRVLKRHDKILTVHLRDEGGRVISAFREIMAYNNRAGCRVQVSHLKTYGRANWHKNEKLLDLVDLYAKRFDLAFDSYPYTAGSTTLTALLPPALLDRDPKELFRRLRRPETQKFVRESISRRTPGWENYSRLIGFGKIYPTGLESKKYRRLEGKSLAEIAAELDRDVASVICEMIAMESGRASMVMFAMKEENVAAMLRHPLQLVGSDGLFSSKPHPRTYGTFPRIIGKFCREDRAIDPITALYKMTKFPADRFQIERRGEIKEGYEADLVIFDYDTISDKATYFNPRAFPEGIKYVILKGKVIYSHTHA